MKRGGGAVEAGEGPQLPVADDAVSCEHLRDPHFLTVYFFSINPQIVLM